VQPGKRAEVLARYPAPGERPAVPVADVPIASVPGAGGRCPGCGYVYDERVGDPREGFPAGTPWSAVPDTWCCPDCGVREKRDFVVSGSA
ncbi:MAG TPA: rubredoxin, partial [Umezawaea sp.]|nr:rubredoxin [Umezawaea sp.]